MLQDRHVISISKMKEQMWKNMIIHYNFHCLLTGGEGEGRNCITPCTMGASPVLDAPVCVSPGGKSPSARRWTAQCTQRELVISLETGMHQYKCPEKPNALAPCMFPLLSMGRHSRRPDVLSAQYKPKPSLCTGTNKQQLRETRKVFQKRNPFFFLKKKCFYSFVAFSENRCPQHSILQILKTLIGLCGIPT